MFARTNDLKLSGLLVCALLLFAGCGDLASGPPQVGDNNEEEATNGGDDNEEETKNGGDNNELDNVEDGSVSITDSWLMVGPEGEFYTKLAHLTGREIGDQSFHFASNIVLSNHTDDARTVQVEVELQGYSHTATEQVEVPANGTVEVPPMNPTFDYDELYTVTSPVSSNLRVEVHGSDSVVDTAGRTVQLQPLNRFRWFWENSDESYDLRPFISLFVTPEDSEGRIQTLLTEAAQYTQTGTIHGYQGNDPDDAYDQARAVYYALQQRGMVYTSVPGSFFDGAQNVKTPAESLATGSANCVDGMLVFASAYEAMGMEPLLIFMEGHAFVGVRLEPGSETQWIAIETTMVGNSSFEDAVVAGGEAYQNAIDSEDPRLLFLDLFELRDFGLTPLNL